MRATVVGKRVFAANFLTDRETAGGDLLDWRSDYDALRYEPVRLPEADESSLLRMTERLGLSSPPPRSPPS